MYMDCLALCSRRQMRSIQRIPACTHTHTHSHTHTHRSRCHTCSNVLHTLTGVGVIPVVIYCHKKLEVSPAHTDRRWEQHQTDGLRSVHCRQMFMMIRPISPLPTGVDDSTADQSQWATPGTHALHWRAMTRSFGGGTMKHHQATHLWLPSVHELRGKY